MKLFTYLVLFIFGFIIIFPGWYSSYKHKDNISNKFYIYYIENDFFIGGDAVILDVPKTCEPEDGFIVYGDRQIFTCEVQPIKDVFVLESAIPEWPYVKIFNCFLHNNRSSFRLMENC